jgi:hypothetical protein
MIIIYHCYGSAHSSIVASAIHVGLLPLNKTPTRKELISLKYFDKTESKDIGTPLYIGQDTWGNQVYAVGMTYKKKVVKQAIYSLLDMYQIPRQSIILSDALTSAHLFTKVGGILSRRYGIISLGRPLTALGMQLNYRKFVTLVEYTTRQVDKLMTNKLDGTYQLMDNRGRKSRDWSGGFVAETWNGHRKNHSE